MNQIVNASAQDWLNALDGVAYLVSSGGDVMAVGQERWDGFLTDCGADHPKPHDVIGKPLFGMIEDDHVRQTFQSIHRRVASLAAKAITYEYRCDAPDLERFMKMSLSALVSGDRLVGVLYQSTVLAMHDRIPLPFLSSHRLAEEERRRSELPLVKICQFCAKVTMKGWSAEWVAPELYYQRGGSNQVWLSHGICPDCEEFEVQPLLGRSPASGG